ncbi:helix-turn-helix domain-containing protein [Nocardia sp. NPDC057663]|uniref:helix-turn-helix domain-containing protein n=1 Tax=Nocardia sp. NPDC057663 TaxID=3346201 RepID=UPI00366D87E0
MLELPDGRPQFSTSQLSASEAFEAWASAISAALIPISTEPYSGTEFFGEATGLIDRPDVRMSAITASPSTMWRADHHIGASSEQYITANIVVDGIMRLRYGDDRSELRPGSLIVIDSLNRIHVDAPTPHSFLTVMVPREHIAESIGVGDRAMVEPLVLTDELARLTSGYLCDVAMLAPSEHHRAAKVIDAAADLLAQSISIALGERDILDPASDVVARRRVLDYVHANFRDPELTIERLAHDCHISKRTLYRLVGSEQVSGPSGLLRSVRVDHACRLLRSAPTVDIAAIACACGFGSARQFYRAFHSHMQMTPGEYRASAAAGRP